MYKTDACGTLPQYCVYIKTKPFFERRNHAESKYVTRNKF